VWRAVLNRRPEEGPCGRVRELHRDRKVSVALVEVRGEGEPHYHSRTEEIYFVVRGEGIVELDGRPVEVKEGDLIVIEPGTVHSVDGEMDLLVVCSPPFDPEDVLDPKEMVRDEELGLRGPERE